MKPPSSCGHVERWHLIALDYLMGKDTLAGLAHVNRVSIDQILTWKENLLLGMRHAQARSAA